MTFLHVMFGYVQGNVNTVFPATWTIRDIMRIMARISGWFQVVYVACQIYIRPVSHIFV